MKRPLLLVLLAASLSSCMLPATGMGAGAAVSDPLGATLTASQSAACPSTPTVTCTTLTYLPGKAASLNTVVHLVGPALRLRDTRCVPEDAGVLCVLGAVAADERRVLYVTGYASSTLKASREDGSLVEIRGK